VTDNWLGQGKSSSFAQRSLSVIMLKRLCVARDERKYIDQNQISMVEDTQGNRKGKDYVINRPSFPAQAHLPQVCARCFWVRISSDISPHLDVLLENPSLWILGCKIHNGTVLSSLCWKLLSCTLVWSTAL